MSLFKSLGGIAKQVTGSVSGFRAVLDKNPTALGFLLPPQVQIGLSAASALNTALGGKLKLPTVEDVKKAEQGLSDILGGLSVLRGQVSKVQLDKLLESSFTKTFPDAESISSLNLKDQSVADAIAKIKSGADLLQSLDWLI